MTDDEIRAALLAALPDDLGPVGLRNRAVPRLFIETSATGYGIELIVALLPVVRRAQAAALRDAADDDWLLLDGRRAVPVALLRGRADGLDLGTGPMSTPASDLRALLDDLAAKHAAAEPGPWTVQGNHIQPGPDSDGPALVARTNDPADAALIAAAVNAIPILVARLRADTLDPADTGAC